MQTEIEPGVVVIGAGVVGLSAAIAAQARGLAVTVLEREAPAAGASAGNAGAFAFTDIFPKLPSPESMAFFALNSSTAPELLITGDLGSGVGSRYGLELRPPLTGTTAPLWETAFPLPTKKIASVRAKAGTPARVAARRRRLRIPGRPAARQAHAEAGSARRRGAG